jgi:hypothetical protein
MNGLEVSFLFFMEIDIQIESYSNEEGLNMKKLTKEIRSLQSHPYLTSSVFQPACPKPRVRMISLLRNPHKIQEPKKSSETSPQRAINVPFLPGTGISQPVVKPQQPTRPIPP